MLTSAPYRAVRSLLILGGMTAALLAPGTVANATTTPSDPAGQLSLKAVDQDSGYFDLTIEPGESQEVAAELDNNGQQPVLTRTYAADAMSLINGGFGAEDRDGEPSGVTEWVSYPTEVVELPASSSETKSFLVAVPAGTAPGQYVSSIVLENETPMKGSGDVSLSQIVRHAVPVAIRVPGPENPALSFGKASHAVTAEKSVISVGLDNTGNVHLKPAGEMIVHDADGKTVSQAPLTMNSIYAGTKTTGEAMLATTLLPGDYTIDMSLTDPRTGATATGTNIPFTVSDAAAQAPSTNDTALPEVFQQATTGTGLYLTIAVIVIAALVVYLILRHRRKLQSSKSPAEDNETANVAHPAAK